MINWPRNRYFSDIPDSRWISTFDLPKITGQDRRSRALNCNSISIFTEVTLKLTEMEQFYFKMWYVARASFLTDSEHGMEQNIGNTLLTINLFYEY